MLKVAVLGSGSWGTALAQHLGSNGVAVSLWGRGPEFVEQIQIKRENSRYLPGICLSENISPTVDLKEALENASALILGLPSSATRDVLVNLKKELGPKAFQIPIISTSKGLEKGSNKRVSQVVEEVFGSKVPHFVMSGPSFASEVARGLPTAVVLARADNEFTEQFEFSSRLFHRGSMRLYTSQDLIGVELGGVLKNIIAIAAGIGDGLKLGLNARAALLTRGLKELIKLIEAEGGQKESAIGLSGLGDLILTATGDLSRNRTFGLYLGEGLSIEEAKINVGQTIEAITTAQSAYELACKKEIDVPIIEQIAEILSGKTTATKALQELMKREQKPE